MRCGNCDSPMAQTGVACLCNHKQYVCQKCKHVWSFDHASKFGYKIDWDTETKMKEFVKENQDKLGLRSYDEYIDKMVAEWKKSLR